MRNLKYYYKNTVQIKNKYELNSFVKNYLQYLMWNYYSYFNKYELICSTWIFKYKNTPLIIYIYIYLFT